MWTGGLSRTRWHFQRQSVLVAPTCGFADQRVLKSISEEQAPLAVVSWGAREAYLAARGPHQLTMQTVVVDRSLDTNGMAS
jgi:hypothetical protein